MWDSAKESISRRHPPSILHGFLFSNANFVICFGLASPITSANGAADLWLKGLVRAAFVRRRMRREASEVVHQPEELLKVRDSEEFRAVGDPRSLEIRRCASEEKIIGSIIAIVVGGGQELEGPSSRDLASPSSDVVTSSRSASFTGDGRRHGNL
ncbi:hypothetical protein TIFTF001_014164 [Ficus carica]|uniref:Uncharacterized protein n=1 Tax=Ficus carica TaxID=3494 RepID=A0AA88A394_FICCA|nr:hypothetical protein TIFTF001_014164 [Ficus carica]